MRIYKAIKIEKRGRKATEPANLSPKKSVVNNFGKTKKKTNPKI